MLSTPTAKHQLVGVGQVSYLISHTIIHVAPLTLSASMLVNTPTSHKVILRANYGNSSIHCGYKHNRFTLQWILCAVFLISTHNLAWQKNLTQGPLPRVFWSFILSFVLTLLSPRSGFSSDLKSKQK